MASEKLYRNFCYTLTHALINVHFLYPKMKINEYVSYHLEASHVNNQQ